MVSIKKKKEVDGSKQNPWAEAPYPKQTHLAVVYKWCQRVPGSFKRGFKPTLLVHAYNLTLKRQGVENPESEANLGYTARFCLQKTKEESTPAIPLLLGQEQT